MRHHLVSSLKVLIFFTLLTGLLYPLVVTVISQLFFPWKANGSLLAEHGRVIGSELIGQSFKDPKYFWPRPSAIHYNPLPSGGSTMSATNASFQKAVDERKEKGLSEEALYASASGLDPHISLNGARAQIDRIVIARQGLQKGLIMNLVQRSVETRDFGFLGEERINVLRLNLALDRLETEN